MDAAFVPHALPASRARRRPARAALVCSAAPATAAKARKKVPILEVNTRAARARALLRGHKSILAPETADFSSTAAALFRKNDTARSFVPVEEIDTNAAELPNAGVARRLLDEAEGIVAAGLAAMEAAAPQIAESEAMRESCRFDLWSILRIVSYAAAVEATDYLHPENLPLFKIFYDEMGLTLAPLIAGIEAMQAALNDEKSSPTFGSLLAELASYG